MGLRTSIKKRLPRKHISPETTNPNYRLVTFENPTSVISECYRRIKISLSFSNVDRHLQVIGITSAVQGEGKTLTLLNTAETYVEDGQKVCVVDLDLRRPKLHRNLRIENKNGVSDVCAGLIDVKDAIKHSPYGFDVINAGKKVSYPTALLGSQKMEDMINELRKMYDVILVDCSPIVPVSDSIIISRFCDGMLFVVSQRIKEKSAAIEGVNILKANNVNLLGCIFTEVDTSNKSYYSNKYKYYHYHNYTTEANEEAAEKAAADEAKVEAPVEEPVVEETPVAVEPAPVEEAPVEEPSPAPEAPKAKRKKKAE